MSDLRIKTDATVHADQDLLLALLAQRADLQARINSLLPANTTPQRSPIHKSQRRDHVPRTMSTSGSPLVRHLSSDRVEASSQQARTLSQHSAPMARTSSRGTTSQRSSNIPFASHGTMPMPPPLLPESRPENPAIEAWVDQDQPLSLYTFSHQSPQLQRSLSQRRPDLEKVEELENVGESPGDFLSRTGVPAFSFTPSPVSIPTAAMTNRLRHSGSRQSFGMPSPTTPSESLTTATTLTSGEMSRQSSLFNDGVLEGIQMMNVHSNTSYSDNFVDDAMCSQVAHCAPSHSRSSSEEQSQLLVGAGGASNDSHFSQHFPLSVVEAQYPSSGNLEKMERCESNESNSSRSSSISASSRSKQRLQAQIAAARKIMPKGGSDDGTLSRNNSSQPMMRLESKDASQNGIAISRPTYQRPKHDRVFCKKCDDHPDGFRGEHELRRHQDRQHKPKVKKWVCIEPVDGVSPHHPKPVIPLSRCKACSQQNKKYGAYYNAAAHLRRAHFKPKAKGRGKTAKVEEKGEKRGGKAGGDWPSMQELKAWMKEIEEPATDFLLSALQQEEDDSEDEAFDAMEEQLPAAHTLRGSSNIFMGDSGFDNPFLADALLSMYPSSTAMQQLHNLQSMQLDPSQASIDPTMSYIAGQPSFDPSFPLATNDPSAAFLDPSPFAPQGYDDQLLGGRDFVHLSYL